MLIGRGRQHKVILFHVQNHLTLPGSGIQHQYPLGALDNMIEERRLLIESIMLEEKEAIIQTGVNPDIIQLRIKANGGGRAEMIVREASEKGYGTIMVGRKGLSKVEEFCIGRVSHKTLQLARDKAVWIVG